MFVLGDSGEQGEKGNAGDIGYKGEKGNVIQTQNKQEAPISTTLILCRFTWPTWTKSE